MNELLPILIINFGLCSFMTGLIWLVQIVHYPIFHFVTEDRFEDFNKFHQISISKIVAPIMLIELATSLWLVMIEPGFVFTLNLLLTILILGSTGLISMPIHKRLLANKSYIHIQSLIRTNWPRTILWSIRCIILAAFIATSFQELGHV